jgi:hypothetical protein
MGHFEEENENPLKQTSSRDQCERGGQMQRLCDKRKWMTGATASNSLSLAASQNVEELQGTATL